MAVVCPSPRNEKKLDMEDSSIVSGCRQKHLTSSYVKTRDLNSVLPQSSFFTLNLEIFSGN